ncbi:hypothetical protein [Ureibacillus chungkukjangi]|uniref:Uncharacterized protein n=1 Tax=Ureibacillus chungkukjangi TaxID=1202712 RepID=A0A318TW99_9BACL|nr:hypothetical protein [Ureibacillus chungkukjangi]PYF06245.1 hypothetical protein BJ095_11176 [Ureibacillus chungkukjangi]
MKLLKKFTFWLPLLSIFIIVYELVFKPVKHPWAAIDPIFSFLFTFLLPLLPDNPSIFYALTLHFLLAVSYGIILDRYIPKIR